MADICLTIDAAPGRAHRLGAIGVAVLMSMAALACLPAGPMPLADTERLLPACGAVGVLVNGLTAALLLVHARLCRRRAFLRLALAFAFCALSSVPHIMLSRGVFAPPMALEGASWLWPFSSGVVALAVCAGALMVVRLRFRTVLSLWLAVAMLAACLDAGLTLSSLETGGGRFSLGWFAAQALGLMTGLCVLFALMSDILREVGNVARTNAQLEQLLQTDVLTGLANRRAFDLALAAEWRRAQREQTAISLLMVDIDCFKGFNDQYGHLAGDGCLRAVGGALAVQAQRPGDVAARIGGEEFGIILPVTEETGALQVAERLRARVMALNLPHACNGAKVVTISVGTATVRPFTRAGEAMQIVGYADRALYEAKSSGRNVVRSSTTQAMALAQA